MIAAAPSDLSLRSSNGFSVTTMKAELDCE